MYRDALDALGAAGYDHYEVSSYARRGHRSEHNTHYWVRPCDPDPDAPQRHPDTLASPSAPMHSPRPSQPRPPPAHRARACAAQRNSEFWGFGLGATSHVGGVRLARPRKMGAYEQFVTDLEAPGGWASVHASRGESEPRGSLAALQTELMLALRTDMGVDLAALPRAYADGVGEAAAAACADAVREMPDGWFEKRGSVLRLTDPEGLLFSNDAISTIFARIDERVEERDGAAAAL